MRTALNKYTSEAGPRQTSDTEKALNQLRRAGGGTLVRRNYGDLIISTLGEDTPEEAAHFEQVASVYNAIHAKHAGTITASNCRAIIADCIAAIPALEASRPVSDERQTPEQVAAAALEQAARNERAAAARAEAEAKEIIDREAVRVQWPELETVAAGGYADQTLAARNIRTELKKAFPGVKFSVTSESYSMGDSIRVKWQNGPTEKAAQAITGKYSRGHFDGMEDMYKSDPEARAFTSIYGGTKYLSTSREYTDFHAVREVIRADLGDTFGADWQKDQHADRMTRNELGETDLTGKGEFIRRDYDAANHKWLLIFEDLTTAAPTLSAPGPTVTAGGYRIEEHTHTKKNFQIWIVILSDRIGADEFRALTEKARAAGGWYSRQWGTTPGGFAFKTPEAAAAFAGGETTPTDPTPNRGERLRTMAAGLTAQIEDKRRDLTQNATPKRALQYRARLLEADDMERGQKALNRLADGLDAGTLPDILKGYTSKAAVLAAVTTTKDHSGGYYSLTCTGRYSDTSAAAVALQALIQGETPEQAARRNAQAVKNKVLDLVGCKIPGFFVTPQALAARVIEEADIGPGDEVLEPSAGTGNLADLARDAGGKVSCIEIRPALCEILRMKGHQVTEDDFTDLAPVWNGQRFDHVILNPPFENGQDAEHVRHAYGFLKDGGRLVAIMSEGVFFRGDSKAVSFRAWLASVGGLSEKLPEGTFQGTGEITNTGTNTRLVIIHR